MTKETQYIEAVGRRKTSIARVRITPHASSSFVVNSKPIAEFFPVKEHEIIATEPLKSENLKTKYKVTVMVKGGGMASQADAIRLGVARALIDHSIDLRGEMKKAGFLKRDARVKERRKFGLKKARKAPQWSKR